MTSQEGFVVFQQTYLALPENILLLLLLAATVNVNMMTKRPFWHIEQPVMVTKLFLLLLFALFVLWFLSIAWLAIVALETVTMRFLFVFWFLLLALVTLFLLLMTP